MAERPRKTSHAGEPGLGELTRRIRALEERVARIETGKPPPGDGRSGLAAQKRTGRRCPGCGLRLRVRAGRCAECGMPLR